MKTNPRLLHRIKFETNKVTIYSANGILATWKGKPAEKFRATVAAAFDWIDEKLAEDAAAEATTSEPPDSALHE